MRPLWDKQVGAPIQGVRFCITDGAAHAVDSSELAFRTASRNALREAMEKSGPCVLEPVMKVQVSRAYGGGRIG